jgi:ribosomal protein S12 methylthiotransferase
MKKYYLVSLGCPKNLVDSEIFAGIIQNSGYAATSHPELADVIIVNTCGFIQDAKQEAIDTILELSEYKITGVCQMLIATGCLVKRYFNDLKLELPEIDLLIDLKDFDSFAEIFSQNQPYARYQLTPLHYAYLRISDGCNNYCSYCAIPAIRGKLQSEPQKKIIRLAQNMADSGVKELIITAQDTTQYGFDWDGNSHLCELLMELEKIAAIKWIRLLYLHPAHLDEKLIDLIFNSKKICNYFEIPIQHASNIMLTNMNRKITKDRIKTLINYIRSYKEPSSVRTTLIVGHPGETEQDYEELVDFVREMRFERLGVFIYSEEEGTPSASLPDKVPYDIAELRKDQLMGIQMDISKDSLLWFLNKTIRVIIDEKAEEEEFDYLGRTRFDCPEIDGVVYLYGDASPGEIKDVLIIDTWEYDLVGKIL